MRPLLDLHPGSFFIGISALNMMGVTMNIVVLFSLILVAGMLVDGVIVTTEYADRRIAAGLAVAMPIVLAPSVCPGQSFLRQ